MPSRVCPLTDWMRTGLAMVRAGDTAGTLPVKPNVSPGNTPAPPLFMRMLDPGELLREAFGASKPACGASSFD
ncbi:MAG: hypothetical protein ACLQU3_24840 [Limisphaerales bacterium]